MVVICEQCHRDMNETDSCDATYYVSEGIEYDAIPYGMETYWDHAGAEHLYEFCGDCHTTIGGNHHAQCDMEECPICGNQMLICMMTDVHHFECDE